MEIPQFKGIPVNEFFTLLGEEPTYEDFMSFVKNILKPHMISRFIEEDYYREIWEDMWKYRHSLDQLPRGHSKTEMVGVWTTIFLAVCQPINPFYKRYPKRIVEQMILGGDSETKSQWSQRIKHFFYESPYLQWLIPEGVSTKTSNAYWNEKVMYLKNGHKILIRAIGERAIRGNHIDRLHADDLVTENSALVDQAIKDKWDGAVDGTTTNKMAMVQVTGTPLRHSDILFHLKDKGYHFKRLPAILDWNKKLILSPNRWTWDALMETKRRIGSVKFQSEYMLDPIDDSTSLIKRKYITQCLDDELDYLDEDIKVRPEGFEAIYMGVDFAFEDRITSDRSAFVIIGQKTVYDELTKQDRKVYTILCIITFKGKSALEQFQYMKELHEVWKFDMIGVEENSIKAVIKHIPSFNLPIKRFWTGTTDQKFKAGDKQQAKGYETVGKKNMVLRIGTTFEQKNLVVPNKSEVTQITTRELIEECISFAQEEDKIVEIGVHPDIPIALGYALEVATRPGLAFGRFAHKKKEEKETAGSGGALSFGKL